MLNTAKKLSRLKRLDFDDIWPDEAMAFTPWLAEEDNLGLLGEALGIPLELIGTEEPVGGFSADILARNMATGDPVVIENQLGTADHRHVGQILTYAASVHAVSVVWIARRFTDEHRASLIWLNAISSTNIRFFGVEIELWQIDSSQYAAHFNIVAKPDA